MEKYFTWCSWKSSMWCLGNRGAWRRAAAAPWSLRYLTASCGAEWGFTCALFCFVLAVLAVTLSPSVSSEGKKNHLDCLGLSGRVVREKNVLFAGSTVDVFADFECFAHLCTLPFGISRQLFSPKSVLPENVGRDLLSCWNYSNCCNTYMFQVSFITGICSQRLCCSLQSTQSNNTSPVFFLTPCLQSNQALFWRGFALFPAFLPASCMALLALPFSDASLLAAVIPQLMLQP